MSQAELARTLRCLTAGAKPHVSDAAFRAVRECGDLNALAELALAQRVAPWVSAALANSPRSAEFAKAPAMRAAGSKQAIETLRLFAELTKLLTQLNAESIPSVVLKGPVLAETYYPDASLRPYGDIDLLIHEPDLARVSLLLIARGYRLKDDHAESHRLHECHGLFQSIFVHPDEGFVVEVHCDHLQIGLEPVSMDTIWETAEERNFGRGSARTLEANDTFVHLCVHLQRHGFARLIWWKDIDLMVRTGNLDWAAVRAKAQEQGCLDSVSYCLWLLPKMLGTPLPAAAVTLSSAQGRLSRLVFRQSWPVARIRKLEPQRQWRLRRLVQFAPEAGVLRGGLPSLLTTGRRRDKLRVLWSAVSKRSESNRRRDDSPSAALIEVACAAVSRREGDTTLNGVVARVSNRGASAATVTRMTLELAGEASHPLMPEGLSFDVPANDAVTRGVNLDGLPNSARLVRDREAQVVVDFADGQRVVVPARNFDRVAHH